MTTKQINKSEERWTGSGYCQNTEIGCDMQCERCIYNKMD